MGCILSSLLGNRFLHELSFMLGHLFLGVVSSLDAFVLLDLLPQSLLIVESWDSEDGLL
jgi:hypothetical protein